MRKPSYFFVVHGEYGSKPPVGGGIYTHHKGYIEGQGVLEGDVLLLFESLGVSGIGIVIKTEPDFEPTTIHYQFFPIKPAVHWNALDDLQQAIPELRTPLVYIGNWLQKISNSSFQKAIGDSRIDWP